MLFELVNETCRRVDALHVERDAPAMLDQIRHARTDFVVALETRISDREILHAIMSAHAEAAIRQVKTTSQIARGMIDVLKRRQTQLGVKLGLAGVLAYFVQPHDLIPDDLPGGYGLVDDALLLRVGMVDYLDQLPPNATAAEQQGDFVTGFASMLPPAVMPQLELVVVGLRNAIQMFSMFDPSMMQLTLDQLIANPLAAAPATPPAGFTPSAGPAFPPSQGRWSGGMYFEGNNVMMPGGPSLIDGKLFIPS